MSAMKSIDIVVFGATGFTGRLIVEYLNTHYSTNADFSWGIAGRNQTKLQALREEFALGDEVASFLADSDDIESLRALTSDTKVVISAAGPYQLYGSKLVQACAETGSDYVDLTGEPEWIHQMLTEHEATAQANGARIVFSCGFDSIPSDLGVFLLEKTAKDTFNQSIPRVKGRVTAIEGGASGGSIASMQASMATAGQDKSIQELLKNPFALTQGFTGPKQPSGTRPLFDEDLNSWAGPFVMAVVNTKAVHRSNALLNHAYGEDLVYDEMVATGPGEEGKKALDEMMQSGGAFMPKGGIPKPGEGPSLEEREAGHYTLTFTGFIDDTKSVVVTISGDQDPGYGSTSKLIAESAICLLKETAELKGGMWTPASAMGDKLIERLRSTKVLTIETDVKQ